jgi:N-acetylglucosaminyldiphosphoundecaprenol N-acetyl-beta-D-mannosaminyltransferase
MALRSVFGVGVLDFSMDDALELCLRVMGAPLERAHALYFVNAHTLNLAWDDPSYREVLRSADWVFGDGTGVRWAVRFLHGVRLRDNVNGTDLVPALLGRDTGLRYFLLGASAGAIERAAAHARVAFPGWQLVGHHHGYVGVDDCAPVVEKINASRPHLLLVGMGNPKQERWIRAQRANLSVPLCMGTGGLVDYWAGDLERAPRWLRALGFEWLHLLLAQPRKFRRYVFGNPLFLLRLARERWLGAPP